jgi:hypothetical protein
MSKIWSAVRLVMIVSVGFPTAGLAYVAEPEDMKEGSGVFFRERSNAGNVRGGDGAVRADGTGKTPAQLPPSTPAQVAPVSVPQAESSPAEPAWRDKAAKDTGKCIRTNAGLRGESGALLGALMGALVVSILW